MDDSSSSGDATLKLTGAAKAVKLPKAGEFNIGRDSANDLVLDDREVSRRHASLSPRGDGYVLDDLQSDNGTFIEREDDLIAIKEPTLLQAGDTVRIGRFRIIFETGTPSRKDPQGAQPWSEGISVPAVTAGFVHFFAGFLIWALVPVLAATIGADFGFSQNGIRLLAAVAIGGGVVARVIFGVLTDARGPFLSGTLALGIGLIPLFGLWLLGDRQVVLWICVALLGVGVTSLPIAIPMASQRTAPERRGIALGIVGAGSLGLVAAAAGGTRLAAALDSWQAVFGLAIVPTGIALLIFVWGSRGKWTSPPAGAWRRLAKSPELWTVSVIYGVTFGVFTALFGFLPPVLTQTNLDYNLSGSSAGLVLAAGAFFGAFARPIGGVLADRFGPLAVLPYVALASGLALIVVGSVGVGLAIVVFILVMTILEVGTGAGFKLAAQRFGSAMGTGAGMVGAVGSLVAFAAVQLLTALLSSTGEPAVAFAVLAAVPIALAAWMFIDARLQPEKAKPLDLPTRPHLQRLDLYGRPAGAVEVAQSLTIGRAAGNRLLLAGDDLVSRHHAIIEAEDSQLKIRDLNSTNGTMLWRNDRWQKVEEEDLRDGDVIVVGSNVLRFSLGAGVRRQ